MPASCDHKSTGHAGRVRELPIGGVYACELHYDSFVMLKRCMDAKALARVLEERDLLMQHWYAGTTADDIGKAVNVEVADVTALTATLTAEAAERVAVVEEVRS